MTKNEPNGHWLYGDHRRLKISIEDDCSRCIHKKVCSRIMEKRCGNYIMGDSSQRGCQGCTNRFARFDNKEPVACFICDSFVDEDDVKLPDYRGTS